MADEKKTVDPETLLPATKIAIGLIESYPEEYLDALVNLSKKVGNSEVTSQLFGIVERIKLQVACSENDLLSLAFMLLLSQNLEPDDQSDGSLTKQTQLDLN